eukprot:TRINITY_DN114826_c0_g1_i1.p1 TRINITY_DN114826_c0_g1~~TRINITY_DN114826_c0_g1_i1.p1  ORF type:complete len:256 (-),score=34.91 TRINITY_DN114826_c0_g1_i1:61-750(-)
MLTCCWSKAEESGNHQEVQVRRSFSEAALSSGLGLETSQEDSCRSLTDFASPLVFEVDLCKTDGLGATFDATDPDFLIVAELGAGLLQQWNATRSNNHKVRVHDRITQVNGTDDTSCQLLYRLGPVDGKKLCLTIQRPQTKEIYFRKPVDLGITLSPCNRTCSLVITSICDGGPIEQWNYRHPKMAVVKDDRIVAVNGITSSHPRDLIQRIKASPHSVVLRILQHQIQT